MVRSRTAGRWAWIALSIPLLCLLLGAGAAGADTTNTKDEAVRQLDVVRVSIDRTLTLSKSGHANEAFAEAKNGYLSHFELVEIPLRVVAPELTSEAETQFAEIRGLITSGAPTGDVRSAIVDLRRLVDDAERRLTDTGIGAPAVVAGQSFFIILREGLEAVLLVSVLLGYLEAVKAGRFRKPILMGMAGAAAATVVTFIVLRTVLATVPIGREVLEAITALVATAMLFYVSFWLIARLEQRRWMEFLRARVWAAVSAGSTTALLLVGFTAVYREGFETALFYEALLSFGPGLGVWVAVGLGLGLVVLAVIAWLIFRLGRTVPVRTFLAVAVILLMATSVAMLGNGIRALQEADIVALHRWSGAPRAPIFLAQSIGYWPSRETFLAQGLLAALYLGGALFVFVIRPRRARAAIGRPEPETGAGAGAGAGATVADAAQ